MAKQEKLTLAKKKAMDKEASGNTTPEPVAKVRTRIFAYRNYVGLLSSVECEGLLNKPMESGQLGFVVDAAAIDISLEAIEILKTLPKSRDAIGDFDIWELSPDAKAPEGMKACFSWMGGAHKYYHPSQKYEYSGSRTWDTDLIIRHCNIVDNESIVDAEFMKYIDESNPCNEPEVMKEQAPPVPESLRTKPKIPHHGDN